MKRNVVSFSELQYQFEVITLIDQFKIKGGLNHAPQWEYAIAPSGDLFWRVVGDETWNAMQTLNEVVITPDTPEAFFQFTNPSTMLYSPTGSGVGGGIGGGGSGGGTDGGSQGNGLDSRNVLHPMIADGTGQDLTKNALYSALTWANSSMGLSLSASEASAVYMGTTFPKWFSGLSEGMGRSIRQYHSIYQ